MGLRRFFEEHCVVGLSSVDKGDASAHKHFQKMVKSNFSSLLILNKENQGHFGIG